jgi:hypothetical protein
MCLRINVQMQFSPGMTVFFAVFFTLTAAFQAGGAKHQRHYFPGWAFKTDIPPGTTKSLPD